MFSKIPVEKQSKLEVLKDINKVSTAFLKFLGIDYEEALKQVEFKHADYITPSINQKGQLEIPVSTYVGLDKEIRKRLRNLNMLSVTSANDDLLNLIDEVEDLKNEK